MRDPSKISLSRRSFLLSSAVLGVLGSRPLLAEALPVPSPGGEGGTLYTPTPEGISIRNGKRFGNRPLYGFHRPSVALAGDRPLVRLLSKPVPLGTFAIALLREGRGVWLHDCAQIEASYLAGRQRWVVRDSRFADLIVTVEVMPLAEERSGFVARISCENARAEDRVLLFYGGLLNHSNGNLFAQADPGLHPSVQKSHDSHQGGSYVPHLNELEQSFAPEICAGNRVSVKGDVFGIARADGRARVRGVATGAVFRAADAAMFDDPARLAVASAALLPVAVASVSAKTPILFAAEEEVTQPKPGAAELAPLTAADLPAAFAAAEARMQMLATRVRCRTPDPYLDASVSCVTTVLDAIFYKPKMVHGAMAWNMPYLGWRTFYGSTSLGWHDRMRVVADHYLPTQVLTGGGECVLDPERLLTLPIAKESRFWGAGHMSVDTKRYDMQAVFFDQLIHAWEATADPELERALLPALQRHLDWERDLFDPDNDGLYEAYLNTWASDSMWYYGSGVSHATAYVIRGHEAAARMAERQGDAAAAKAHRERAEHSRKALERVLWLPERGHLAESIEPEPYRRVHEDATLYSVNIPVDCRVLSRDQGIQIIDYADWGLERVRQPAGGSLVYTSNFVPDVWSVRELDNADTLHTAIAAFKVGMVDDGWELLRGIYLQSMYGSAVPGGLLCEPPGNTYSSTDFSDPSSLYARAIVEGVFGWQPDAPSGSVRIAPNLPADWDHAEFATPDFTLSFRRDGSRERWEVTTARDWRIELLVPQRSSAHVPEGAVMEPGLGRPAVLFTGQGQSLAAEVPFEPDFAGRLSSLTWVAAGSDVLLMADGGAITGWQDPQGVLSDVRISSGRLHGRVVAKPGRHLVFADVTNGAARWRQLLRLEVASASAPPPVLVPAPTHTWRTLSLEGQLDAALTAIYKQRYLEPRLPCSAQLGVDGWTAWTHSYWGVKPPVLGMGRFARGGRVVASNGVPFELGPESRNIALTSTWSNYPTSRQLPVAARGRQLAVLLSGTTNQMQSQIENARLTVLYSNGHRTQHPIHHPHDFWSVNGKYSYSRDAFALPKRLPVTIDFDSQTRGTVMLIPLDLDTDVTAIELETLSPEVSIGVMALSMA